MKAAKNRRREPGFSLLANVLGKEVRTIRRWIADLPELRRVLRVRRHGKQWRIDYPKTAAEFNGWVETVRQTVAPFTRTVERRNGYAKRISEALGFGNQQRERDIEILRHAMLLKYASRRLPTNEADDDKKSIDNAYAEWESEAADYWPTARLISAHFNCRVEDAPRHWHEYQEYQRERNRQHNAPQEDWLKKHGLYDRAKKLLTEKPGTVFETPTAMIQLLPVATDAEIQAECERVNELWPEPEHWQRAKENYDKEWQLRTLADATLELVGDEKPVTGKNLAPLLFRNPTVQDCWNLHETHLKYERQGHDVFPNERAFNYGKRGISLREFRQRYGRNDVAEAKKKVEGAMIPQPESVPNKKAIYGEAAEDNEHVLDKDKTGVGERDAKGKPLTSASEKKKDFVTPETALRVRREFAESSEELEHLTPTERQKIEQALGRRLKDYIKNPHKEDFEVA